MIVVPTTLQCLEVKLKDQQEKTKMMGHSHGHHVPSNFIVFNLRNIERNARLLHKRELKQKCYI